MNFPRHWAKGSHTETDREGQPLRFDCWGWSDEGEAAAAEIGRQRAERVAKRAATGEFPGRGYGYPDRPMREPVLREIQNEAGDRIAVLTRNAYGCAVLNTDRAMFVDVDLPKLEHAVESPGFIGRLFGARPASQLIEPVLAKAEAWAAAHAGWSWRIYRTRAGLRLLATHATFDPLGETSRATMQALGADPLYLRLCAAQECYRARLSPKPWRCGLPKPPARWPFPNDAAEQRYRAWESDYVRTAAHHATCALIRTVGSPAIHPAIHPLVELHDKLTAADSRRQLA